MVKKLLVVGSLLFLLILIVGIGLYRERLESPYLREILTTLLTNQISRAINGTLTIGSLEGNLFEYLILTDVKLRQNDQLLLSVPRLVLHYNLRTLWQQQVTIKQIVIDSPHVSFQQLPDGTWNIAHLIPEAPGESTAPEPEKTPPGWYTALFPQRFVLEELRMERGQIALTFFEPSGQQQRTLQGVHLLVSGEIVPEKQKLHIQEFRFTSTTPAFVLEESELLLTMHEKTVALSPLLLRTTHSRIQGTGITADLIRQTVQGKVSADLHLSEFSDFIPGLSLQGTLKDELQLSGPFEALQIANRLLMDTGTMTLTGTVNLTEPRLGYDLRFQTHAVNFQDILPQENLQSNLNSELVIQGKGLSPAEAEGTFRLEIFPSRMGEVSIASSLIEGKIQEGLISLETLDLNAPFAMLKGGGKIDLQGETSLTYSFYSDLSSLSSLLPTLKLSGRIQSQGAVQGSFQNLEARGELHLEALTYNDLSLRNGTGTFQVQDLTGKLTAEVRATLDELLAGTTRIEQTNLEAHYTQTSEQLMLDLLVQESPARSIQLRGTVDLGAETIETQLSTLRVRINGKELSNFEPIRVAFTESQITIHSFRFGNAHEVIQLSGTFNPQGKEDLQLQISNLQLQTIDELLGQQETLGGQLNATLTVRGDFQEPELLGQIALTQGKIAAFPFDSMTANFIYQQKQATVELVMEPHRGAKLALQGVLPIDLSFGDTQNRLLALPLNIQLSVQQLHLATLHKLLTPDTQMGGVLNLESKISGTYWKPVLTGNIHLTGGRWGSQWEKVAFRLHFQGKNIALSGYLPAPDGAPGTPGLQVGQFLLTGERLTATQRLSPTETITREIQNLLLDTSFRMRENMQQAEIKSLRFRTRNPEVTLQTLQAQVIMTPTGLTITLPTLQLQESQLQGEAKITLGEPRNITAVIQLAPISLPEIGKIVGTPLEGKISGRVVMQGVGKNLQIQGNYQIADASFQHTLNWEGETAVPVYTWKSELRNLNLVKILPSLPATNLNMELSVQGKGLPLEENTRLEGALAIHPSQLMDVSLESSRIRFGLQDQRVTIIPSTLHTSVVDLQTEGKVDLGNLIDLHFRLSPKNLQPIQERIGANQLAFTGTLAGKISGPLQNPGIAGSLQAKNLRYNEIRLEELTLDYKAENLMQQLTAQITATLSHLQANQLSFDKLNLKATAQGSLEAPVGQLELVASEGRMEQLQVSQIKTLVNYGAKEIRAELLVFLDQKKQLQATALLPNPLTCKNLPEQRGSGNEGLPSGGQACSAVQALITSHGLDLSLLEEVSPLVTTARGPIDINLRVQGTLTQPEIQGQLQLRNGALTVPQYGIRYRDLRANIQLTSQQIRIDPISFEGGKGRATLTGVVNLEGFALKDFQLQLYTKDFTAVKDPAKKLVLNTRINLEGTPVAPQVRGDIVVLEARFPVKGIGGSGLEKVEEKDLRVQVLTGEASQHDGTKEQKKQKEQPDILKNLAARLRIRMDKNVWVQAPDGSIELRGDIVITQKPGGEFILEGSVETVRGFYRFQGRKFVVQQGRVTFPGTTEIDPNLNIVATYRVSGYQVNIAVSGTARKPSLNLSSEPPLEQIDILSLLAFGKTANQLSESQEFSLANQAEQLAGGVISGKLQQTLGKELGLDTIDISTGTQGFSDATVSAGKYVAEDVFVSYEQQLGKEGGSQIKVEYDISKNFSIETTVNDKGNSGADLIWKFDY